MTETLRRLLVCVFVAAAAGAVLAESPAITPAQAIASAVSARMGAAVEVTIDELETSVAAEPGLIAALSATARFGKPAQFVLSVNGTRRGVAVATVRARATFPVAVRAIAREEEIGADAVSFTTEDVPAIPIKPLLDESGVIGLQARRAIAAGEPLTATLLKVPPVVKSGDEVEVTVRIRAVRVTGSGIASGSGQVGDIIRITQPKSSRLLKGRITGPGAVEIVE